MPEIAAGTTKHDTYIATVSNMTKSGAGRSGTNEVLLYCDKEAKELAACHSRTGRACANVGLAGISDDGDGF